MFLHINEKNVVRDIGVYKNRLISHFLDSNDICEILLNKNNLSEDEIDNLIYSRIFPYLYVNDTQVEAKTYLCFEVDIPRVPTGTIKDMKIIIWAYCHKDLMKYSKKGFLGTRTDILADAIERSLRDSDRFGIGKLQLDSVTYLSSINPKFYGRSMVFTCPEFKESK